MSRTTLDFSCNLCLLNGSGRLELLRLHVESSLKEIFNTYLWLHSHWSTRSVKRVIWSVIISSVVEVICTSSREGHINIARFQVNWGNSIKRREVCTCLAQLFRGEIKHCWPRQNQRSVLHLNLSCVWCTAPSECGCNGLGFVKSPSRLQFQVNEPARIWGAIFN